MGLKPADLEGFVLVGDPASRRCCIADGVRIISLGRESEVGGKTGGGIHSVDRRGDSGEAVGAACSKVNLKLDSNH